MGSVVTDPADSALFERAEVGPQALPGHRFDPPGVTWVEGACPSHGGTRLWFRGRAAGTTAVWVADVDRDRVERVAPGRLWPVATADGSAAVVDVRSLYLASGADSLEPSGRFTDPGGGRVVAGPTVASDGERVAAVVEAEGERRVVSVHVRRDDLTTWVEGYAVEALQCNPTDPTLLLLVGKSGPRGRPAWLAREGLGARPIRDALPDTHRSHQWAADGTGLWYLGPDGVEFLDLAGWRRERVWSTAARALAVSRDGGLLAVAGPSEGQGTVVRARARDGGAAVTVATDVVDGPWFDAAGSLAVGTARGLAVVSRQSLRASLGARK